MTQCSNRPDGTGQELPRRMKNGALSELIGDEQDVWRARAANPLSYPEDGNVRCFALEDSSFWFRHRNDCIVAAIRRFPPAGPILDVGGGNGYVSRRIIDDGFEAILLEPGPGGAINAKTKRHLPDVICGLLEDVPFEAGSVAALGLFDVLEHIENDIRMIRELHRVLVPGGLIYLTVPAHRWLWSLSDVKAQHFRRYNLGSLQELFQRDFEVLYASYFFRPLVLPLFLLRSIPYRIGIARRRNIMNSAAEHGTRSGWTWGMMARWLRPEVARVAAAKPIQIGASCLLVASRR